jgi:hypothetical protein
MFVLKVALGFLHCPCALKFFFVCADKKHLLLKSAACYIAHTVLESSLAIRLILYSAILPVLLQLMHVFTYGESKAKRPASSC